MLHPFLEVVPVVGSEVFVAPSADVIGDVRIGDQSPIWFHATIRGDVHRIRIGDRTNVQDNAVVHVTNRTAPTIIGDGVTIGHSAVVHGCTIEDDALVGMGAIILDHAVIGSNSLVAAGALVTGGTIIPPNSLVVGRPGRVVRALREEERVNVRSYSKNYVRYARVYLGLDRPDSNPFYDRDRPGPTG